MPPTFTRRVPAAPTLLRRPPHKLQQERAFRTRDLRAGFDGEERWIWGLARTLELFARCSDSMRIG